MSAEKPDQAEPVVEAPQLFLVKGQATAEAVAALTVVLQSVAAANVPVAEPEVISEWSANHRKMRAWYPAGPGGWRSSGLPR